jgi:hypothetical protein
MTSPKPVLIQEATTVRCGRCGAQPKLTHTILDPRKGDTLRMYKCDCGEQTWTTDRE